MRRNLVSEMKLQADRNETLLRDRLFGDQVELFTGAGLPYATLCYVWDPALAPGTVLPNAYSRRVRFMVADGLGSATGQWQNHQRTLAADFLRAFGDEARQLPPAIAVVIGADADNTAGRSLGYIGDLKITP